MGGPIKMERKGYESIGCYTYYVTLSYDLDHRFSRSNFEKLYLRNGRADWHGAKGMWVDRMLDPRCDFELWPHPWPWPWIFKVKFFNSNISGMGGSVDLEWKGCELDMMLDAQWHCSWGHSAWQIHWPSNGAMWNCYSFQPVGPLMGCPFTDLGAEGCCRSLNALFYAHLKNGVL